jgi:hypothetical protein
MNALTRLMFTIEQHEPCDGLLKLGVEPGHARVGKAEGPQGLLLDCILFRFGSEAPALERAKLGALSNRSSRFSRSRRFSSSEYSECSEVLEEQKILLKYGEGIALAARVHGSGFEQHRCAHAGLVAGVGARPVLEVGDEGGLAGVEEGGLRQALTPQDGEAEGRVGVDADGVAHEGAVLVVGVVVGEANGALDMGGDGCLGAGDSVVGGAAAHDEAHALLKPLQTAARRSPTP